MTKTMTKTKTQTKCLKNPTYAIFMKSWWLTHSKFDDRYLTLVILFTQVTLVSLFRSYNQFYRAECITVSGFLSWCSSKILKLKFGHYFAADAWLWLWCSILVEILKLGLVKIYKFKFCWNADVWLRFWSWCLVNILKMFDQDLCNNFWYDLKKLLW